MGMQAHEQSNDTKTLTHLSNIDNTESRAVTRPSLNTPSTSNSNTDEVEEKDSQESDDDEFHDCLSWAEVDLEVGVDVGAVADIKPAEEKVWVCECCKNFEMSSLQPKNRKIYSTNSLPKMAKDSANRRMRWLNRHAPPQKTAPDGTTVHYWCDMPPRRGSYHERSFGM